jgi:hypothetical protein
MLIRTRYTATNAALLVVGTAVCLATGFMAQMTAGFGADPVHDFKSAAIVCDILAALMSVPFYLTMFRWCGVGLVGVWCMAMVSLATCLVTGMEGPTVFFTILLVLQGLICSGINSVSNKVECVQ